MLCVGGDDSSPPGRGAEPAVVASRDTLGATLDRSPRSALAIRHLRPQQTIGAGAVALAYALVILIAFVDRVERVEGLHAGGVAGGAGGRACARQRRAADETAGCLLPCMGDSSKGKGK